MEASLEPREAINRQAKDRQREPLRSLKETGSAWRNGLWRLAKSSDGWGWSWNQVRLSAFETAHTLYPKAWTVGSPMAKVALLGLHADSSWVPKTLASSHCSQILYTASQIQTKASILRVPCS